MKIIDLETFPRRSHYEFFKSYAYPYMGITANVDVTNLYDTAKKTGGSPFLAFLWAAANAANSVPELRQRIVNDQIVEYAHCNTAHTVALPDGTFVNCRRAFAEFQSYGKQCQEEAKTRHGFVQPGDDETQLIFVSSTPGLPSPRSSSPPPFLPIPRSASFSASFLRRTTGKRFPWLSSATTHWWMAFTWGSSIRNSRSWRIPLTILKNGGFGNETATEG